MKKKIIFSLLLVFSFVFVGASKVSADEVIEINQEVIDSIKSSPQNGIAYYGAMYLFHFEAGTYKLTGDITLGPYDTFYFTKNITLDLGTYTINGDIRRYGVIGVSGGTTTIKGSGTIDNNGSNGVSLAVSGGKAIIQGNVNYAKGVSISAGARAEINGGTFNGVSIDDATVTINGGVYNNSTSDSAIEANNSTIIVNGGTANLGNASQIHVFKLVGGTATFTGGTYKASYSMGNALYVDGTDLNVSGGTFTGYCGLRVQGDNPTVQLSGGTFISEGPLSTAAIRTSSASFEDLLAYGYRYSVPSVSTYGSYSEAKVSVIPITYTVTFKDYDGTVLKTQENVEHGSSAVAPSNPTREGYTFTCWDKVFDNVTGNLEVIATYESIPSGEVENKIIDDNIGNASINNTTEELKEIIELTSLEKTAINNGKNLYVFVEVSDISNSITSDDKTLIEKELTDGSKVGMYLDVNLFKQIGGEDKLKVSFVIPESLIKDNRTFYIVRIHNGVVTKITPTINKNTLTFETDRFSTYALVYNDEVSGTNNNGNNTTHITNNPQTGYNVSNYIYTLVIGIICLAGGAIYLKRKKIFKNR